MSTSTFEVPQFQREYSWGEDEVSDFWSDLQGNLDSESYFVGLIILTEETTRKHVVDGQQRIITLSLLATALYHEAKRRGRPALADRLQADFLRFIDYESDETAPRVCLSDESDDRTFQAILLSGEAPSDRGEADSVSRRMIESYEYLCEKLQEDLALDPFKRLGRWTDFITNRLYFAVFVHPDPASAYQVYEVINTRGKELTTSDLLKNYILSQTAPKARAARYVEWQKVAKQFQPEGTNNFVQYIRHVVTVGSGHILPKDLFGYLANRVKFTGKTPPSPDALMSQLEARLPLYMQMIDPTLAGPADEEALGIFAALNSLGVIAVRPILLAIHDTPDALEGMKWVLKLVVRRIIVGNLGTGNVERRFGEAAKKVFETKRWDSIVDDLSDLNPDRADFVNQLRKRSFNKGVLTFIRRSIMQGRLAPNADGVLHFIWTRQASEWVGMGEEDGTFWGSTLGNTYLSELNRRPKEANSWQGFQAHVLPTGTPVEITPQLLALEEWNADAIEQTGKQLAERAGDLWF